jgi:N-carbamoyl-L-amino-acid hydrolase
MMSSTIQQLKIDSERMRRDFDELAQIGATSEGGVSRIALSHEDLEGRAWLAHRIEEAGLLVRDDEVGNLSGVLPARTPDAQTFLMGSHLDTVPNGGRYDGSIGVLAALEVLRTIKEAGLQLPVHLEAINFTDEEGAWQSFFGSMGLTGTLSPPHINDVQQDNGAFRVALFRAGIRPGEAYRARREPDTLAGFLELHIEQSDKLQKAGCQIGVVERVVGRATFNYNFYGEAVHAATTSPDKQRDALQGAAIFITEIHRLIAEHYPQGVVNCGNVNVQPGAFNVVPSQASLQVECRHPSEKILSEIESRLIRLSQDCARRYRLSVKAEPVLRRPVAHMSREIISTVEDVCDRLNHKHMRSISYAGHDAQILSKVTPSGMIFVPSVDGISHNPREFTEWDDVTAGANVMLHTLLRLIDME